MTPAFKVLADGTDVTAQINDRLIELVVVDHDGTKADEVTIRLDDRDFRLAKPRKGTLLAVFLGYLESGLASMGMFKVNRVHRAFDKQGGATMEITGKSADLKASMKSQRTGQYDDKSLREIVEEVAGRHGLGAKVSQRLGAIRYAHEPQTEESDLHLLTRLARDHDAIFKVAAGKVLFLARGEQAQGVVTLRKGDFTACAVEEDDRSASKECNAHWRDRGAAKRVRETREGGEGGAFTLRHTYPDKELAEAAAAGKQRQLARKEATLTATLPGRTDLMAGTRIATAIGADPYDGVWTIATATHRMAKQDGYTTEISTDKGEGGEGG